MGRAAQLTLRSVAKQMPTCTPEPDGEHGEVFTRRWVVELILDAVGYQRMQTSATQPSSSRRADMGGAIRGCDLLAHNADHDAPAIRSARP